MRILADADVGRMGWFCGAIPCGVSHWLELRDIVEVGRWAVSGRCEV